MDTRTPDVSNPSISVLLIGPDAQKRTGLAEVFERIGVRIRTQLAEYPSATQALSLVDDDCDAVVLDVDANPQTALSLVESLCGQNQSITAMLYSGKDDPDLLVNCMRAGARELIRVPASDETLNEAVMRTARRGGREHKRPGGKKYVFRSAKGGAGASTLAANFAIELARESNSRVALVDLNDELGDLSVLLNLSPRFSILDAVRNPDRLDWDLLAGLMEEHKTGVHLLAAPDRFVAPNEWKDVDSFEKVFHILEQHFSHVVVDAGRMVSPAVSALRNADAVFIVCQVDVPSLRKAQRLASHWSEEAGRRSHIGIVLNRFDSRNSGISSGDVERTLTFPVQWRVPNDFARATNAANTGLAVAEENSAIARTLRTMAQSALGKSAQKSQVKSWGFFKYRTATKGA